MNRSKFGGIIKKTAAVILSMIMVFGAASVLPDNIVQDNAIVANAEIEEGEAVVNGCVFKFYVKSQDEEEYASISDAEIMNIQGRVEIPSTVTIDDKEIPVTRIGSNFLNKNQDVKTVIFPDSITYIEFNCLSGSTVEHVTISENINTIGNNFCSNCSELKHENVIFNGKKLLRVDNNAFSSSPNMVNDKGAVVLGNWLIKYEGDTNASTIKIADFSSDKTKIERVAAGAFANRIFEDTYKSVTTIDLEGIKYIGGSNFFRWSGLTTVLNPDSLEEAGASLLDDTPWRNEAEANGLARLGGVVFYYKTNSTILDLTSGEFEGVKYIVEYAFEDCKNLDTIKCSNDCTFSANCFYSDRTWSADGPLSDPPRYKIKTIYLDGKLLEFTKDDPVMPKWFSDNYAFLSKTRWFIDNVEAKTKALFDQLDITYYGLDNHMKGRLSPTEEFYIALKVHEYMSTFNADLGCYDALKILMNQGRAQCAGYATLTSYMLQCAGVNNMINHSVPDGKHAWNQIKIGDEWFEFDMGWDEQIGHIYDWFALSSTRVAQIGEEHNSVAHVRKDSSYTWSDCSKGDCTDYVPAARTIGDLNGNEIRDDDDIDLIWDYIKGNISLKDTKAADINFDGVVDITDGVLLENFLHGHSVDPNNYPTDALSPGFNVVFADNCKPEDIDPNYFIYDFTDRDGCIVLPESEFKAPEGMKFAGWDYGKKGKVGKVGERVKISNPYTVIQPIWKDEAAPDDESEPDTEEGQWLLGDVDASGVIDIGDVSMLINHINGVKALDDEALLRADVNKSDSVDISDASAIVNHINGVKAIEGTV